MLDNKDLGVIIKVKEGGEEMNKLIIVSLLSIVLLVGYGYFGQAKGLSAASTLSIEQMRDISAGVEGVQEKSCHGIIPGCCDVLYDETPCMIDAGEVGGDPECPACIVACGHLNDIKVCVPTPALHSVNLELNACRSLVSYWDFYFHTPGWSCKTVGQEGCCPESAFEAIGYEGEVKCGWVLLSWGFTWDGCEEVKLY